MSTLAMHFHAYVHVTVIQGELVSAMMFVVYVLEYSFTQHVVTDTALSLQVLRWRSRVTFQRGSLGLPKTKNASRQTTRAESE